MIARLFFLGIVSLVCVQLSAALLQAETNIGNVLRSSFSQFKDIQSLQFECRQEVRILQGSDQGEVYHETMWYVSDLQRFKYEAQQETGGKGIDETAVVSFDGAKYWYFTKSNSRLSVSSSRSDDYFLAGKRGFFEPFAFFRLAHNEQGTKTQIRFPTLSDFRGVSPSKLEKDIIPSNSVDFSETRLMFKADRFVSRRGDSVYTVTFDPDENFFPTRWERRSVDGAIRETYDVVEFGRTQLADKTIIPWPKKAIRKKFYGDQMLPHLVTNIEVSNVKINETQGAEKFSLDPLIASRFFDVDSGIEIDVPR